MSNDFSELVFDIVDKREKVAMIKALTEALFHCCIGLKALEYNHEKQLVTVEFYEEDPFEIDVNMDSPKALMLDVLKGLTIKGYL